MCLSNLTWLPIKIYLEHSNFSLNLEINLRFLRCFSLANKCELIDLNNVSLIRQDAFYCVLDPILLSTPLRVLPFFFIILNI